MDKGKIYKMLGEFGSASDGACKKIRHAVVGFVVIGYGKNRKAVER